MAVCYRHSNRETGVSCSNCGNPICTECMTSTSVGMRCPDCAGEKTRVRTAAAVTRSDEPGLTYLLIGINVAIALGSILGGADVGGGGLGRSPITDEGALLGPAIADGDVWRILTSGFLHGGIGHLFFNMFSLYILGSMLEPAIGRARFALIYFVSLLAGSFGALVVEPNALTVGASGAIFGLMGAAIVIMRNRGINPMESGLGLWLGLNLLITFAVPGISIGGHIGGLIGGALAAAILYDLRDVVRVPPPVLTALTVLVGVLSVVGALVVSA